jgi:hypothetical protein
MKSVPVSLTPPADEDAPRPLIFDHGHKGASLLRLSKYLCAALVAYAAFFYLFKVVTPSPTRAVPKQHQLRVLDTGNPAWASVLEANEYKVPAAMWQLAELEQPASDAETLDQANAPAPYLQHKARPDIHFPRRGPFYNLLTDASLLPPLARPTLAAPLAIPTKTTAHLALPEALAKRYTNEWRFTPSDAQIEPSVQHHLQIAVGADGRVEHVMAESPNVEPALLDSIRKLRFQASLEPETTWHGIDVTTFARSAEP